MKQRIPSNVRFFHTLKQTSAETIETAKSIVEDIDCIYEPEIDNEAPNGAVEILYHTRSKYLSVVVSENGQIVSFRGSDTSGSAVIEGKNPTTYDMAFLGRWLEEG